MESKNSTVLRSQLNDELNYFHDQKKEICLKLLPNLFLLLRDYLLDEVAMWMSGD